MSELLHEAIPLSLPDISEGEIEAVVSALRSGRLSLGPRLQEFEERVARFAGMPHGVAVSSGTAGLHLCLIALGIGPGDEVIVPSFTFIAAANAIRYVGAVPVFVDIDAVTLNMDPVCVRAAVTPGTKALMVVHTFGHPAAMRELLEIASEHGLRVIEDACEALGAVCEGLPAGSFGDAAVFAFYPNKQITTGEGGMIVTRSAPLARELRALRNQGRYESDAWHQHSVLGYNYRLSEIACALGCAQMERIDDILERREQVAATYTRLLGERNDLVLPAPARKGSRVSWFVYVVRLAGAASAQRDAVLQAMAVHGLQCGRYFAPVHSQPAYTAFPPGMPLPVTEAESAGALALPFFTAMTSEQVERVVDTLKAALDSSH